MLARPSFSASASARFAATSNSPIAMSTGKSRGDTCSEPHATAATTASVAAAARATTTAQYASSALAWSMKTKYEPKPSAAKNASGTPAESRPGEPDRDRHDGCGGRDRCDDADRSDCHAAVEAPEPEGAAHAGRHRSGDRGAAEEAAAG